MKRVDVCVLGAGMAGLTLAIQLRQSYPELAVTLLEHRQFPFPPAAHKVGESTVEIAAHYLAEKLGLRTHLEEAHIPKFGLRYFFRGNEPLQDLSMYDEIGISRRLPIPTYQLDRGVLENHLCERARSAGATVNDGATVSSVDLRSNAHRITYRRDGQESTLVTRYVVDASGRRGLLRTQQALERPVRHDNAAVWFRVEGDVDIDRFGSDSDWRARCHGTPRRLSTNHFMGPGYWVWLIPLASNATSVGIVFDPHVLEIARINNHQRFMRWLEGEHPLVAEMLAARRVLDFHVLDGYARNCATLYSRDGWMMSGDAGVFADPLYSPGSDFIAIANTFITNLIGGDASHYGQTCAIYQAHFRSYFTNTLSIYRGQYKAFGNRNLLVAKTLWDYAYYWAVLAKLFFSGAMTDTACMASMQKVLVTSASLNADMQSTFRKATSNRVGGQSVFVDHYSVPWFHESKGELLHDGRSREAVLAANVARLKIISRSVKQLLADLEAGQPLPALNQLAGFS